MRNTGRLAPLAVVLAGLVAGCPQPRIQARPVSLPPGEVRVGVVSPATPALAAAVESALLSEVPTVQVVAHAHQGQLAAEKELQVSGHYDNAAIVAIGAQLGATMLVVAEVDATKEQLQLWGKCNFACLRELVVRRAVAALFGQAG